MVAATLNLLAEEGDDREHLALDVAELVRARVREVEGAVEGERAAEADFWRRIRNRNVQHTEEHDDEDRRDELGHRLLRRAEEEEFTSRTPRSEEKSKVKAEVRRIERRREMR